MPELSDHELLAQHAQHRSESAFAALVQRHIHLVHSVAWRCTGNPHAAEEITQAVFVILARKAGGLRREVVLSGWLYHTARLTAANYTRAELHRVQRESEAHMQATLEDSAATTAWEQIAPLLEEAMGQLGRQDRNAVVLRYFENKTAPEIAVALNLNEEAAQKRVRRALEKLRKFFLKRGVTLTATGIAGAVSAHSVMAAPAGLVATVTATTTTSATLSAGITTLVKGTLKLMAYTKLKWMAAAGVAALLAGGITTVAVMRSKPPVNLAGQVAPDKQSRILIRTLFVKTSRANVAAFQNDLTPPRTPTNPLGKAFQDLLQRHPGVSVVAAPSIDTADDVGAAINVSSSTNHAAGISLEITPKIQLGSKIDLQLQAELREFGGIPPAIQTTRLTVPKVSVTSGGTIMLNTRIGSQEGWQNVPAGDESAEELVVFINVLQVQQRLQRVITKPAVAGD